MLKTKLGQGFPLLLERWIQTISDLFDSSHPHRRQSCIAPNGEVGDHNLRAREKLVNKSEG